MNYIQTIKKHRRLTLGALVVIIGVIGALYLLSGDTDVPAEEKQLPLVSVQNISDLREGGEIEITSTIKSTSSAPLIARQGGRVTGLSANLGDNIRQGALVAQIDGASVANPVRAQITGLNNSLTALEKVSIAASQSAAVAIDLAKTNLNAATAVSPINLENANVAREQADLAVEQARLALEDALETANDDVIRAADIATKNAGLAQDQATLVRQLAQNNTAVSVAQARAGVETAQAAAARSVAEIGSQRSQLQTQLGVAQAQLRQQQVSSPISGQIVRLSVQIGDYVTPGQQVGEVNGLSGARLTIQVPGGVRQLLTTQQQLKLTTKEQSFFGSVARLASVPASATGLWQVDISIISAPAEVMPNDIVTVKVPAGANSSGNLLVPLDSLVVRQAGTFIFTVASDGSVSSHKVKPLAFIGNFAEIEDAPLPLDSKIITEGNRTLQEGDIVAIRPASS